MVEPERREGLMVLWGERARSGSLTDRLGCATVEVTAGLLQARGKVLTSAFLISLRRQDGSGPTSGPLLARRLSPR